MRMQRIVKTLHLDSLLSQSNGIAAVAGAILGPIVEILYGPDRLLFFYALTAVIVWDWISGIAAARKDVTYSSHYGLMGIFRTIFILWFPVVANILDKLSHTPGVFFYPVIIGTMFHVLNSATANAYRAGWKRWIPSWAINFVSSEIKAKAERAMKMRGGIK